MSADTISFWDRVARCETGSNWKMHGSRFSGGVGFANSTWTDWAVRELGLTQYPYADNAPRLVQIVVADYGRRFHNGYWGCI